MATTTNSFQETASCGTCTAVSEDFPTTTGGNALVLYFHGKRDDEEIAQMKLLCDGPVDTRDMARARTRGASGLPGRSRL